MLFTSRQTVELLALHLLDTPFTIQTSYECLTTHASAQYSHAQLQQHNEPLAAALGVCWASVSCLSHSAIPRHPCCPFWECCQNQLCQPLQYEAQSFPLRLRAPFLRAPASHGPWAWMNWQ